MAQVIAWRFDRSERRFVLKFSDRRRVKVKTKKAILSMDEAIQRDILALGVPTANNCERTKTIIRILKRRFPADNDDDDVTDLLTVNDESDLSTQDRLFFDDRRSAEHR
ncbi:hypothetical protein Hanom_Chr16g01476401 [Helianthus anomalus]